MNKGEAPVIGRALFCPLTEKSDSGEASVNFSTDIDYEWQNRSRQRAEEAAGANRKQAVHYRTAGQGVWNPSYPCHAEAGRNDHSRPNTQQHGLPCLRQGGQRAFANHSRQHQRRRTDTQGCTGPLHHRRWHGVSRLSVRRGAAIVGGYHAAQKEAQ